MLAMTIWTSITTSSQIREFILRKRLFGVQGDLPHTSRCRRMCLAKAIGIRNSIYAAWQDVSEMCYQ